MTSQSEAARGADIVFVPPPLYYAAGLAVGMLVDELRPFPVGARPATALVGVAVGVLGLALSLGGVVGVIKHRTTIVPHHAVATLVTSGGYRLSRNPMYTGLGVAYLGVALLFGSWWPVVLWPVAILAIHRSVIRPEERYLAERFGEAYSDYQAHVRRWL